MILTILTTACLVALSFFVHFAVLSRLAGLVHADEPRVRRPLLLVLFALFAAHLFEVFLYALALSLFDWAGLGTLAGAVGTGSFWFFDHFYFSIAAYTTLGLGDIVPQGELRLISGVEALNGLFLIAWSASFTYLMMERVWGSGAPTNRK